MKQYFRIITKAIAATTILLCMLSCMKEEEYVCPVKITIGFDYTFNSDNKDLFTSELDYLSLYLFDSSGQPVYNSVIDAARLDGQKLTLEARQDDYNLVVWGNLDDIIFNISGDNLEDMRLTLTNDKDELAIVPENELFYGSATIQGRDRRKTQTQVSLIRNTKTIRVLFDGIGDRQRSMPRSDYSIRIAGNNATLKFDNSSVVKRPTTYRPEYSAAVYGDEIYSQATFSVIKLRIGDDTSLDIYKEDVLIKEEPLTELIMENFPMIRTDEDLDRYSDYTFVYEVDDDDFVLVEITAGPWTVVPNQQGGI